MTELDSNCKKCKLFRTTTNPAISSVIPSQPQLAFIAEAPGQLEEERGIPLIGQAGENLNRALVSCKIDRASVMIGNIVRCRPPNNRTPSKKEVDCCKHRIIAELNEHRPKIIVALGLVASKTLINDDSLRMSEVHGQIFNGKQALGFDCVIIPTWHPSPTTFVYNPDRYTQMVSDIALAGNFLNKFSHMKNYLDLDRDRMDIIVSNLEEWAAGKKLLDKSDYLVFDLETTGLDFLDSKAEITNIGLTGGNDYGISILVTEFRENENDLNMILKDLKSLFASKKVIAHHMKFDAKYLYKIYKIWPNNWYWDTALAHSLLYPGQTTKLKRISYIYTSMGGYEFEISSKGILNTNAHERARYNIDDCVCTYRIFEKQVPLIKANNQLFLMQNIVMPASKVLAEIEYFGFRVDENYVYNLELKYNKLLNELKTEIYMDPIVMIYNSTKGPLNLQSPKQIASLLFDKEFCGYTPIKYTAGSKLDEPGRMQPSCSKEVLTALRDSGSKICDLILQHSTVSKLLTSHIRGIKSKIINGRVHTKFHQDIAISGRTSCSDPPLHQIPKQGDIRSIFQADPGFTLIDADYKQMELVVSTFYTKDPVMLKAIQSGDAHSYIASKIFGFTDQKDIEEKRKFIKILNFSVLYGAGPTKLASVLGVSEDDAKNLIDEYFRLLRKTKEWLEHTRRQALTTGKVYSLFGRFRMYGQLNSLDMRGDVRYNSSVNHPIQSTASDLMLYGLINWRKFLVGKNLYPHNAYICLQIHDEILSCVRNDIVDELVVEKKRILESTKFDFMTMPLSVEIKMGERWGSCETSLSL